MAPFVPSFKSRPNSARPNKPPSPQRSRPQTATRRPQLRYKAFVIPVINGKYVVVQNSSTKNLTFAGGGCQKTELNNIRKCAARELAEETRGSIVLNKSNIPHNAIVTFNISPNERNKKYLSKNIENGVSVTMRHKVFLVPLKGNFNSIKQKYHSKNERNLTSAERETINIFLMSHNNLKTKLWKTMKEKVLNKLPRRLH